MIFTAFFFSSGVHSGYSPVIQSYQLYISIAYKINKSHRQTLEAHDWKCEAINTLLFGGATFKVYAVKSDPLRLQLAAISPR